MARTVFVYRPDHPEANHNGMVDRSLVHDDGIAESFHHISDIIPETRNHADGKVYTSKSEFRKATRRAGCVEVGNDTAPLLAPRKKIEPDRKQRREDFHRAINMLKNGYQPRIPHGAFE